MTFFERRADHSMQSKMARARGFVLKLYQLFFRLWFPVFLTLCRYPRLINPVASAAMALFALLKPRYTRAVISNYRVIFPNLRAWEYRRLARRMMIKHSRYWIEFFRLAQFPVERLSEIVENTESSLQLLNTLNPSQGAILLTGHIGNWELGGIFFSRIFRPIQVVYVRDRFDVVEQLRSRFRRLGAIKELPVDRSLFSTLPALRALEDGEFLALQGDRDFNNQGVPVEFFGRMCRFPEGPYQMAVMTGVPILPTFFLFKEEVGKYEIRLFPPLERLEKGCRADKVLYLMKQYVRLLEQTIRERSDQWYAFYPFFDMEQDARPESDWKPRRVRSSGRLTGRNEG